MGQELMAPARPVEREEMMLKDRLGTRSWRTVLTCPILALVFGCGGGGGGGGTGGVLPGTTCELDKTEVFLVDLNATSLFFGGSDCSLRSFPTAQVSVVNIGSSNLQGTVRLPSVLGPAGELLCSFSLSPAGINPAFDIPPTSSRTFAIGLDANCYTSHREERHEGAADFGRACGVIPIHVTTRCDCFPTCP